MVGVAFYCGVSGASSWLVEEVCRVCSSGAIHVRRIHCGEGKRISGQEEEMWLLFLGG